MQNFKSRWQKSFKRYMLPLFSNMLGIVSELICNADLKDSIHRSNLLGTLKFFLPYKPIVTKLTIKDPDGQPWGFDPKIT